MNMSSPVDAIRSRLNNIQSQRRNLILIACQQRAKFEGWLKFELASAIAHHNDIKQIILEDKYPTSGRSDMSFIYKDTKWYVEMKTANTNWRAEGLQNITRPIKLNIDSIISDIQRLQQHSSTAKGLIIFLLFPIPTRIWEKETERLNYHLQRIEEESHLTFGSLMRAGNFNQITEHYGICTFVKEVI
jgi:hypothetical protein